MLEQTKVSVNWIVLLVDEIIVSSDKSIFHIFYSSLNALFAMKSRKVDVVKALWLSNICAFSTFNYFSR